MMYINVKIFLVILMLEICGSEYCENPSLKSNQGRACYMECKTQLEYLNDLNATYNVDPEIGLLVINFSLPPLNYCHTDYEIQLLVNEEIKDEFQCQKNKAFREMHSIKEYTMKKCENETAMNKSIEQHGMAVFNNIFTGCYKLKIKPHRGLSSCPTLFANKAYIKTNFTKEYMPNVYYYHHYSSYLKKLDVKYVMETNISEMKIEFSHSENHKLVYGRPIKVKEKVVNENFTCQPSSIWDPKRCTHVYESVTCTFHHVSPGNYSIFVAVSDDRCNRKTLWTKKQKCIWKNTIECNEIAVTLPILMSSSNINLVSAVGIVGTAVLLILLVVFICKKKKIIKNELKGENNQESIPLRESKIEILLLYPRDCKQFMTVMDSFRKFLNTFKNVKVSDCYSEEVLERGPFQSLVNKMSNPTLCTIIVDTQCARLQQEAMRLGTITLNHCFYRDPSFIDSIFKYGLKYIMEDLSPDIYHKYYVIGFDGFTESKHELVLPTSLRRYIMPNHLDKLLTDVKIDDGTENFNVNSLEYTSLREDIKSLAEFKSNNPFYLENILNLS